MNPNLDMRLAYLAFETHRTRRWDHFCQQVLGLRPPLRHSDGSQGYQMDGAAQRLLVTPGPREDLAAIGIECVGPAALDRLLDRLAARDVPIGEGTPEEHAVRRVQRLFSITDPAGNAVELVTGLEPAERCFQSPLVPGGFCTGDLGMGHVALAAHDLRAMTLFYTELLGFGVTESLNTRVGPIVLRANFLHCNTRHHSIALMQFPLRRRLHHFMLQCRDLRDVCAGYERAVREGTTLSLDLGQHPAPDDTLSFYGFTPSGFEFELGALTRTIEAADWRAQTTSLASAWGHRPRLRTRLNLALGWLTGAGRSSHASQPVLNSGRPPNAAPSTCAREGDRVH
jgi:2,3-dihydroxybiphenyl 1,2-dioxygenase